jgi:hypothetical protein
MTLLEKFDDWCDGELNSLDRWVNSQFCRTSRDIQMAQDCTIQHILGATLFIQTLDNAPTFEQIDSRYEYWKNKIENFCELKKLTN